MGTTDLAVKVRYPGIDRLIEDDLASILSMSRITDAMGTHTNSMTKQLADNLRAELDYAAERETTERIGEIVRKTRNQGLFQVRVPIVFGELCEENIIVSEYIEEATSLGKYIQTCPDDEKVRICQDVIGFIFACGLEGFVLGDPHWGNFLVTTDGQLYAVDFGHVARVEPIVTMETLRLVRLSREACYNDWEEYFRRFHDVLVEEEGTHLTTNDYRNIHTLQTILYDNLLSPSVVHYTADNVKRIHDALKMGTALQAGMAFVKSTVIMLNIACYCEITCSFRPTIEALFVAYGSSLVNSIATTVPSHTAVQVDPTVNHCV
jgi:tRNA A-37 threonylcarbamoyl transferase component Bud32